MTCIPNYLLTLYVAPLGYTKAPTFQRVSVDNQQYNTSVTNTVPLEGDILQHKKRVLVHRNVIIIVYVNNNLRILQSMMCLGLCFEIS
jgi:hypothetical protein